MTFEEIRNLNLNIKHILVDEHREERRLLGFGRFGCIATDSCNKVHADYWHEIEIKNWELKG